MKTLTVVATFVARTGKEVELRAALTGPLRVPCVVWLLFVCRSGGGQVWCCAGAGTGRRNAQVSVTGDRNSKYQPEATEW